MIAFWGLIALMVCLVWTPIGSLIGWLSLLMGMKDNSIAFTFLGIGLIAANFVLAFGVTVTILTIAMSQICSG